MILKSGSTAFTTTGLLTVDVCCVEELDEVVPVLPGSEQLRLQQSRASEAWGPWLCAFLQQSGKFDIGHEPSRCCAPTPTAPVNMTIVSATDVSHFRMTAWAIVRRSPRCQTLRFETPRQRAMRSVLPLVRWRH